jgi:hypothetical protein
LGNYSIPSSGGEILIDQPNSILNGTKIILPKNAASYSVDVNLYRGTSGENFTVNTNMKGTYEYILPKAISKTTTSKFDHIGTILNTDFIIKSGANCFQNREYVNNLNLSWSNLQELEGKFKYYNNSFIKGKITFWYDQNDPEVVNALNLLSSDKNLLPDLSNNLNIFIRKNLDDTKDIVEGGTYSDTIDSIFVEIPKKYSYPQLKMVVSHEFYHTVQNKIFNCERSIMASLMTDSFYSLFESSAHHYGYSILSSREKSIAFKDIAFAENPKNILKTPLKLAEELSKFGIMNWQVPDIINPITLEPQTFKPITLKPMGVYNNLLMWDFFDSTGYFNFLYDFITQKSQPNDKNRFIKYLDKEIKSNVNNAEISFIEYSNSKNIDIGNQLAVGLDFYYKKENYPDAYDSKLLHPILRSTIVSPAWNTQQEELYRQVFEGTNSSINLNSHMNFIKLTAEQPKEKEQVYIYNADNKLVALKILEDVNYYPLSAERSIVQLPEAPLGFDNYFYDYYLEKSNDLLKISLAGLYDLNPAQYSSHELKTLDFSENRSGKDSMTLDIVNPTSKNQIGSIKLRSYCQKIENVSGYYQNIKRYETFDCYTINSKVICSANIYPVDRDHGIKVKCNGERRCAIEARLCSNKFEFSSNWAFYYSDLLDDCYIGYSRIGGGIDTSSPGAVGPEGVVLMPTVTPYSSERAPLPFALDSSYVNFNDMFIGNDPNDDTVMLPEDYRVPKMLTGQLIVCEIPDVNNPPPKGEENLKIETNVKW